MYVLGILTDINVFLPFTYNYFCLLKNKNNTKTELLYAINNFI